MICLFDDQSDFQLSGLGALAHIVASSCKKLSKFEGKRDVRSLTRIAVRRQFFAALILPCARSHLGESGIQNQTKMYATVGNEIAR